MSLPSVHQSICSSHSCTMLIGLIFGTGLPLTSTILLCYRGSSQHPPPLHPQVRQTPDLQPLFSFSLTNTVLMRVRASQVTDDTERLADTLFWPPLSRTDGDDQYDIFTDDRYQPSCGINLLIYEHFQITWFLRNGRASRFI